MSEVVQFPLPQSKRNVEVVWKVRAYRKSDFSLVEGDHDDEPKANAAARRLYSMGYDITVRRHIIEHVADWVYDEDWSKDKADG